MGFNSTNYIVIMPDIGYDFDPLTDVAIFNDTGVAAADGATIVFNDTGVLPEDGAVMLFNNL